MKVISFNANGIRSAARKGFFDWLQQQNADFVCIQETKAHASQLHADPIYCPATYYCDYVDAEKKGYSGVAIYAKKKPEDVIKSIGYDVSDSEGRYLQFDYDGLSVISLYLPSGSSGPERQAVKFNFLTRFQKHLLTLRETRRSLIICGDINIAHKKIDIKNWRGNQKNSGFLPEERAWLDEVFGAMGFVDAFRAKNQLENEFTWWSNRGRARENNVGWRIDYQVVSPDLLVDIMAVNIYRDEQFSDHAPLIVEYNRSVECSN